MGEIWGVLAAVLASGLGGTSIGATRYLANAIDPLAIGSFRFGIGFLLLLPIAALKGPWPVRRDWLGTGALGVLYFALFPILFNASLIYTAAARGALALSTLPLLTMLVGAALGSEQLTRVAIPAKRDRGMKGCAVRPLSGIAPSGIAAISNDTLRYASNGGRCPNGSNRCCSEFGVFC